MTGRMLSGNYLLVNIVVGESDQGGLLFILELLTNHFISVRQRDQHIIGMQITNGGRGGYMTVYPKII